MAELVLPWVDVTRFVDEDTPDPMPPVADPYEPDGDPGLAVVDAPMDGRAVLPVAFTS